MILDMWGFDIIYLIKINKIDQKCDNIYIHMLGLESYFYISNIKKE